MRNPWPIFVITLLTGSALAVYTLFFPYQTLWIAVAVILVMLILAALCLARYEERICAVVTSCLSAYREDQDLPRLQQSLELCRRRARTRYTRCFLSEALFHALLEQEYWDEAEAELEIFRKSAQNASRQKTYHLLRADYAAAVGDFALADREMMLCGRAGAPSSARNSSLSSATSDQCKRAFWCWLSFAAVLTLAGILSRSAPSDSVIGSLGTALLILNLFAIPVAAIWLILWLVRLGEERRDRIQ